MIGWEQALPLTDWLGLDLFGLWLATSGPCCSLIGWKQALSLGMLENGGVAEIVLLGCLDAEGTLRSHPSNRLANVKRPDILQLGQTDIQRTKSTYGQRKSVH